MSAGANGLSLSATGSTAIDPTVASGSDLIVSVRAWAGPGVNVVIGLAYSAEDPSIHLETAHKTGT